MADENYTCGPTKESRLFEDASLNILRARGIEGDLLSRSKNFKTSFAAISKDSLSWERFKIFKLLGVNNKAAIRTQNKLQNSFLSNSVFPYTCPIHPTLSFLTSSKRIDGIR